ncbi:hypothetical protein [Methanotorris formicicus]|uniref:Uncharacterized protein n=1 Tax=Methanotorris formicicus Mc-S-70 TaxID=647171 RepID=H1L088_9EURY|nr:hypothetical protein MetfoDRAFT_1462 [Methanotorris formicicus Mc-S-70]
MLKNIAIKTKSKILEVRLFLFILRAIIHNLWVAMQWKNKNTNYKTMNLKEFVIKINELIRMHIYTNKPIDNTQLCIPNAYSEILLKDTQK